MAAEGAVIVIATRRPRCRVRPATAAAKPPAEQRPVDSKPTRRKLSSKDQREYDGMEAAILEAEQEAERLDALTRVPATVADHARAAEAYAQFAAATDRVKALYERWAQLEAMQGG
jgi:ATP-binding cassette subfamily F protein uup